MGRNKKTAGAKLTRDKNPEVEASEVEQPEPDAEKSEPVAKEKPPPETVTKAEPKQPPDSATIHAKGTGKATVKKDVSPGPLFVAKGKSLITKRGIRAPGDDVTAQELAGGEEYRQELKDKGFLEKEAAK